MTGMVDSGGRSARGLAAAAAVVLAGLLQFAAPAQPALAAASGLTYTSAGTWTADPRLGRVHVDVDMSATSHAVDNGTRRYFFPGMQLTLPLYAAGYVASDTKGNELALTVVASTASGVVVYIPFGQRLYSGESYRFNLKFDLVDMGGSTDRDLRIGQDIMSFPVRGFGSPGVAGSYVNVVFPTGYVVQEQFGTLTSTTDLLGQTIFSSGPGPAPDPYTLTAWFTATRDVPAADFQTVDFSLGALDVTLRYWSDDPGWATAVERTLVSGYPILQNLIGLGPPAARALTIEEATTQGIGGFSGEYDQSAGSIRVSYFADPVVILHEIAHLWFNDDLASDRWINEGFASYYAEQAVLRLGLPDHAPALGPALMASAMPLNQWGSAGTPGTATQAYFYGASLEAAREIAGQAGPTGLQAVWLQAKAHSNAYADRDVSYTDMAVGGSTDWRRLLDYLENSTGKPYSSIWEQWVVTPQQEPLLAERGDAVDDYDFTLGRAAGWSLPADIRQAMSTWQFGRAQALMAQARQVLAQKLQIRSAAVELGLTAPSNLRNAFETGDTGDAASEAHLEISALQAISGAEKARTESQGAARVVGLLGADPDAKLGAARAAFGDGDSAGALSLAEAARAAWAGAAGVGQLRIVGAALGGAGALILLAIYLATRPARRRRAAENPRPDPGPTSDG